MQTSNKNAHQLFLRMLISQAFSCCHFQWHCQYIIVFVPIYCFFSHSNFLLGKKNAIHWQNLSATLSYHVGKSLTRGIYSLLSTDLVLTIVFLRAQFSLFCLNDSNDSLPWQGCNLLIHLLNLLDLVQLAVKVLMNKTDMGLIHVKLH